MNKIFITGASGLLGGNLCHLFSLNNYRVVGIINNNKIKFPDVAIIDINEFSRIDSKIDCIIHCAAKTNVDECEKDIEEAKRVNVSLTESVINIANRHNALLMHISTDAVYKDDIGLKSETSVVEPLSIYAKSKWEAEEKVRALARKYFIIRTNIFGYNILDKYSLGEWIYYNLLAEKPIKGFNDVLFSPILVNDLYKALHHLIQNASISSNEVLNIGAVGSISKYNFACAIADQFKLDKSLITPVSIHDFDFIAPRVLNTVLDSTKFERVYHYSLPTITEEIEGFYELFQNGYVRALKNFNIK